MHLDALILGFTIALSSWDGAGHLGFRDCAIVDRKEGICKCSISAENSVNVGHEILYCEELSCEMFVDPEKQEQCLLKRSVPL